VPVLPVRGVEVAVEEHDDLRRLGLGGRGGGRLGWRRGHGGPRGGFGRGRRGGGGRGPRGRVLPAPGPGPPPAGVVPAGGGGGRGGGTRRRVRTGSTTRRGHRYSPRDAAE